MATPRPFTNPPEWEHAKECAICKRSFGMMRRQHHCRNCGASVCQEHSSSSMPLIALGMDTPQRVCDKCRAILSKKGIKSNLNQASSSPVQEGLAGPESEGEPMPAPPAPKRVVECKCGMPLCICVPDEVLDPQDAQPQAQEAAKGADEQARPKPKRPAGQNPFSEWSMQGGGGDRGSLSDRMREAVKSGDHATVSKLIGEGADVNHADEQGNQPLHLAAMMSHTQVVRLLLENGAETGVRNRMGELPTDLASVSLATKINHFSKEGVFL